VENLQVEIVEKRKQGRPKTIPRPYCEISHEWGVFIVMRNSDLVKPCKHCPALLTRAEFFRDRIEPEPIPRMARLVVNVKEHLDLWW